MPGCVDLKFFDRVTEGIPDRAITWGKRTLWLELKFRDGRPTPAQDVMMKDLARAGMAYYVRFDYHLDDPVSRIIHPITGLVEQIRGHSPLKVAQRLRKLIEESR